MNIASEYEIHSLKDLSFETLHMSHSEAFSDYFFHWDREALTRLFNRRGFSPELSFGAFKNGELLSFTFNCIRNHDSLLTAYDCGTGTVPEHRNKGLAKEIFRHSIPHLKAAGVSQYLLEVLESNQTAQSVYLQQGFKISRRFECFVGNTNEYKASSLKADPGLTFIETDSSDCLLAEQWLDFIPSWQNTYDSIDSASDNMKFIMAYRDEQPLAMGVIESITGDIPLLAVSPEHRRKKIGSILLQELLKFNQSEKIRIVNIPDDRKEIIEFIKFNNIPFFISQFEMSMTL